MTPKFKTNPSILQSALTIAGTFGNGTPKTSSTDSRRWTAMRFQICRSSSSSSFSDEGEEGIEKEEEEGGEGGEGLSWEGWEEVVV